MAQSQENPPTQAPDIWHQIAGALLAALAQVVVKGIVSAFQALEKQLSPWDGATERRAPQAPEAPPAGGTP